MCDCVSLTRRVLCHDYCRDCVDCWEWLRSLLIDFCNGFTAEACGEFQSWARDKCECDVGCHGGSCRDAGQSCGQRCASCASCASRACCCVFGFVRDLPLFVGGVLLLLLAAFAVVWVVYRPNVGVGVLPTTQQVAATLRGAWDAAGKNSANANATAAAG